MSKVRTAGEFADLQRRYAIELLELWVSELRSGDIVVETFEVESPVESLPLRRDEPAFDVNAPTGRLSLTMKARRPDLQRRYAEQLLERL